MSLRIPHKKVTKMMHKISWWGDWSQDLINAAIFALITLLVIVVFSILKVKVCWNKALNLTNKCSIKTIVWSNIYIREKNLVPPHSLTIWPIVALLQLPNENLHLHNFSRFEVSFLSLSKCYGHETFHNVWAALQNLPLMVPNMYSAICSGINIISIAIIRGSHKTTYYWKLFWFIM